MIREDSNGGECRYSRNAYIGGAACDPSSFAWVDERTGKKGKFVARITSPGTCRWGGLALEEWRNEAGEIAEGYAMKHIVALHMSDPMQMEFRSGRRSKVEHLASGRLNILPARMPYSGSWDRACRTVVLEVAPELLTSIAGGTSRGQIELRPGTAITDPLMSNLVIAVHNDATAQCPSGGAYGESLAIALAAQLVRYHSAIPSGWAQVPREAPQSRAFARVLEYVNSSLGEEITVSQLASIARMGPYQFTRSFKRAFGKSPHQYVIERRIEFAKTMLRTSKLPVSHIALDAGFATPNHFSSVFRQIVRIPPSLYRKSFNQ